MRQSVLYILFYFLLQHLAVNKAYILNHWGTHLLNNHVTEVEVCHCQN